MKIGKITQLTDGFREDKKNLYSFDPDKPVHPIMISMIRRGLKRLIQLAEEIPDEEVFYTSNHEQDLKEHKEAIAWISRYIKFQES